MPPQIKQDLNRSGWETTDFPSVCEACLGDNPYVKMLKEDYGEECKLCSRPFTVFSWATDRSHGRKKRTNICLTCARLKNACQCCVMDLQFGLPIAIRDKALELVAPGPQSEINREYFAQNNERAIEEGRAGVEVYEKTEDKALDLLRRLAQSKPYFRKGRSLDEDGNLLPVGNGGGGRGNGGGGGGGGRGFSGGGTSHAIAGGNVAAGAGMGGPGPIRTRDTRAAVAAGAGFGRGGGGGPRRGGGFAVARQPPPGPQDWLPPDDTNIMSLFVTGIEDDLAEFKIREFFKAFGKIKSLVVSHMSHCAFVNYETRGAAETAAAECKGRAVIGGCPLRIRWGQPKAIGMMNKEERADMIRDGRSAYADVRRSGGQRGAGGSGGAQDRAAAAQDDQLSSMAPAAPPGAADVQYASLTGN